MKEKILVINAGSSSIKFNLFDKESMQSIASGLAERIGLSEGHISIKYNDEFDRYVDMKNHENAVDVLYKFMQEINLIKDKEEIKYIGFRVVQGADYFSSSTKLDAKVVEIIEKCSIYAPLHNPGAVQSIKAFEKVFPKAKMSADFDTAFHTTIDRVNSSYAIDNSLVKELKIKRYGAHGISHYYITKKLEEILKKDKVTFVNLHIGNGGSLCAVKDSKSFDTSMGLTPLAGIMMGTRSGDIDPSIHAFVKAQKNMSVEEFTDLLNKKSGLLGVSEVSSDMRDVRKAAREGNTQARFALDLFAKNIVDYIAKYFNSLGGKLDAIVFTAGIGENDIATREEVVNLINFRKVKIDPEKNLEKYSDYKLISTPDSEIKVYVIRTNEELVIAKNALKLYDQE
ncbi:acetate/propionate family kinase [Mycoplasmopsis synoviae]|uniref:Acetate kinase n=2 Tax=Mycoplasmopsis synoviae TaxID=2109 RepID=Q4A5B2_MYCS5|nr:acetate/propionate family kinase [Mycoplasmopsis synoviae]AAZ44059.2 acetate kinase [Mycoplasmopsis synoviae 53]AKB11368.1 acetate kinase [Mycoplasmopsis synoviae ATCC 25204]AKJ20876.1 Acetate kinase [Mycoplasmopsis synoviae]AQU48201.1 Acetate kinase [Mycoplasmopsis synoviae]AWL84414.1 acetate kinase [Mycoplasmopsis synoviae]